MSCYWAGSEQPRLLGGRHGEECAGDECRGCQPCREPHCRVCAHDHAEHTCPGCVADARETLSEIQRMCAALPTEVVHRGVDSEAMNLLGPAADPEQTGHVAASVRVGRLPEDWLEAADHELHPLLVLGTWTEAYCEAFDHDEPTRLTVAGSASYLDRNLTYASTFVDIPFEDFARDLRACQAHMERVLHDGEQRETGAPCMTCRVPLVREWGKFVAADGWRCPRCREWRSDVEYRLNVADLHRNEADWLTDREMELRTGVKAGTVRKWAERGVVDRRRDTGRTVFRVEQVAAEARRRSLIA